ncbi:hypothetical protein CROQUDRAFT_98564 [Cronartium quercuum f. sp. fusiforme G11]|uniref:Uncharacterized protein n=1 Tax=Cronartium quercuum f. sp. fusiforme G11 TaxID=708437 RepID=A0A9P6T7M2_9BASI|nr:hypothetical protein CROQUDRAFT_98564 [Cronartium quercuum f. sp. fusiforme G11]
MWLEGFEVRHILPQPMRADSKGTHSSWIETTPPQPPNRYIEHYLIHAGRQTRNRRGSRWQQALLQPTRARLGRTMYHTDADVTEHKFWLLTMMTASDMESRSTVDCPGLSNTRRRLRMHLTAWPEAHSVEPSFFKAHNQETESRSVLKGRSISTVGSTVLPYDKDAVLDRNPHSLFRREKLQHRHGLESRTIGDFLSYLDSLYAYGKEAIALEKHGRSPALDFGGRWFKKNWISSRQGTWSKQAKTFSTAPVPLLASSKPSSSCVGLMWSW